MGAPRPPWRWCWDYHLENLHHLNGSTWRQVHDGFCFTTAFASYLFNWASWVMILYWNLSRRQSSFSSFNVNNHGFSGTCGLLHWGSCLVRGVAGPTWVRYLRLVEMSERFPMSIWIISILLEEECFIGADVYPKYWRWQQYPKIGVYLQIMMHSCNLT